MPLRLLPELPQQHRVGGRDLGLEELDRHRPVVQQVLGLPDLPQRPRTDDGLQAIPAGQLHHCAPLAHDSSDHATAVPVPDPVRPYMAIWPCGCPAPGPVGSPRSEPPKPDRVVRASEGEGLAVGAERDGEDGAAVSGAGTDLGTGGHVPRANLSSPEARILPSRLKATELIHATSAL